MFRSALVALKPGSANQATIEFAVQVAIEQRWSLIGLSVIDFSQVIPAESVPLGAGPFKAHKDEQLLARARAAADLALEGFTGRCQAAGVTSERLHREGQLTAELTRAVQGVDLLVLGHNAEQDVVGVASEHSVIHQLLSHCPRPAIVVPAGLAPQTARRSLIAYDGSLQAARALQSFVESGLAVGSEVHLLDVLDEVDQQSIVAPAVDFLRRHDIAVQIHNQTCRRFVAQEILDRAQQLQIDLLVMGAYGKSTLSEFFFGSVTRHLLSHATFPIFLDQ